MERAWKLGDDLNTSDNLLDGITFDDLILAVHHNCREITPGAVRGELAQYIEMRFYDMKVLLERNMDEIIEEAKKGRG